jgi:protein TonB
MNSKSYRKPQLFISNMFKINNFLFFILFLLPISAFSQTDDDKPFILVEQMPRYKGCEKIKDNKESMDCFQMRLSELLGKNIVYPYKARQASIEGTVYISFIVDAKGKVRDVMVKRGIGYGCDEEAVRVIKKMPKFTPGTQRGKPVKVVYNVPIAFKLR